jgi:hypothetical protein
MNSRTKPPRCAGKPVPDNQQRAIDMTHQRLEKVDPLRLADRIAIESEVEVAQSQAGCYRQLVPVEMEQQHWRLAARRPAATAVRLLRQSAFVEEDDRAALVLGFFLMLGQVLRCPLRIASSLRSRARPTGRCGLQFNARRIFQTWPSW